MSDDTERRFLYVNTEQLSQGYCEEKHGEVRHGRYVLMPRVGLPDHIHYVSAPPLFSDEKTEKAKT